MVCNSSPSWPAAQFIWKQNGIVLENQGLVSITTTSRVTEAGLTESDSILSVNPVGLSHSGNYSCEIIQEDVELVRPLRSSLVHLLVTVGSRSSY